mgnify:CR=1 FL=1
MPCLDLEGACDRRRGVEARRGRQRALIVGGAEPLAQRASAHKGIDEAEWRARAHGEGEERHERAVAARREHAELAPEGRQHVI